MKKRIISIFLIVSIIVSVCAIGFVTSSASSRVSTPQITSILVYPNKIRVYWSHDSKNTKLYGIGYCEQGKANYTFKYTTNSKARYYDFTTGFTPQKSYNIKMCAYESGKTNSKSNFCSPQSIKFKFPQKPIITKNQNKSQLSTGQINLTYGVMNYTNGTVATYLPYAKSYDLMIYEDYENNNKYSRCFHSVQNSYSINIPDDGKTKRAYKIRGYCVYKGKGYLSEWSDVTIFATVT